MAVKCLTKLSAEAVGAFCRKILAGKGEAESENSQYYDNSAHFQHIAAVTLGDAVVYHFRHDHGNYQLKYCLQKLEKWTKDKFLFVTTQES